MSTTLYMVRFDNYVLKQHSHETFRFLSFFLFIISFMEKNEIHFYSRNSKIILILRFSPDFNCYGENPTTEIIIIDDNNISIMII